MIENISLTDIQDKLKHSKSVSQSRRELLINEMSRLESEGKDCFSCSGMCCTYEFNSMLVTPLESIELLIYLESEGRMNEEILTKLETNIKDFRLDREVHLGKNKELRRYYTCPFYKDENKGCSISRSAKPYGCLGFNPRTANVRTEGKCGVNENLHIKRSVKYKDYEDNSNKYLSELLELYWSKKPISVALREMIFKLKLIRK